MRELDFDNLSADDEAWLRAWNRGDEIPNGEDDEESEMVYDLRGLLKPQLQEQARMRGLDEDGTVAELTAAIENHDADNGDDADEE